MSKFDYKKWLVENKHNTKQVPIPARNNLKEIKTLIKNKLISGGASKLVDSVGSILDDVITTDDEKLEAKRKLKELILNHEAQLQKNVTDRWKADMNSDSWLSKNVRPLVLIFLVVSTVLMIFIDAGAISFTVEEKWTDLLQLVLITVIGAYFGGRSLEKRNKK